MIGQSESGGESKESATTSTLLVRRRGVIKGRLTNFKRHLDSYKGSILSAEQTTELKLRIEGLQNLFIEYLDVQSKIDSIVSDLQLPEQAEARDTFESDYYSILAKAKCLVDEEEHYEVANESASQNNSPISLPSVKLPTLNLPDFDGSYERWLTFRDSFISLVHNCKSISEIQKFHYLKSSLKGEAEGVVDAIEVTSNNYTIAWELLFNRYNNTDLLVHNHLKSIFTMPNVSREAPDQIRKLIDTTLRNLRSLQKLGEPTTEWDTIIIYIVMSKLDSVTEREWKQQNNFHSVKSEDKKTKLEDLIKFLTEKANMLSTLSKSNTNNNTVTHDRKTSHKVNCNIVTEQVQNNADTKHKPKQTRPKLSCSLCGSQHPLYSCQKFLDMAVSDRQQLVKNKRLCENCLRSGHNATECRLGPCRKCERKHNSLLCDGGKQITRTVALHTSLNVSSAVSTNTDTNSYTVQEKGYLTPAKQVLLSTALVDVPDGVGNLHRARALLDSGSERTFVTKSFCNKLNAQLIQSTQKIHGVGNTLTQCTQSCKLEVRAIDGTFVSHIQCLVLDRITSTLPNMSIPRKVLEIPHNVNLADPTFYESQQIDILIGADKFWDLLQSDGMRLPSGPYLQKTRLGYIVSGPILYAAAQPTNRILCNMTSSLESQLRMFWELEELPASSKSLHGDDNTCEAHFIQNTTRTQDGRFCVKIPFKLSPDESLGDTYAQAQKRFYALENRLNRNPNYKKMYTEFIHEYIELGHMSPVNSYGNVHYFMPHHGVFREHATTTKLRVVFDASAASSSGFSLNDLQLIGPPIQGDLVSILLRFREHKYVACADIEKFYRCVLVDESQRDLQLILWRDNPTDKLGIYRLNTVTYGTASAPFLSCRCLKQLASECNDPELAQIITDSFYVDDFNFSAPTKDKLMTVCEAIANILKSGCFPLRKWVFNFDNKSPTNSHMTDVNLSMGENVHSKTLGIGWYPLQDELYFHTKLKHDSNETTKRTILSSASQIYDPLGLLSPVITIAKILIQKCWLLKLDWDVPAPDEIRKIWDQFISNLQFLNDIRVPRHVLNNDHKKELHIFTDASQSAYGACAYVHCIGESVVKNTLLCSKGKVASIKPVLTIPRLELCGAVMGARLYTKITESFRIKFDKIVFWTDSTIVLGWLHTAPSQLKSYVHNRCIEIIEKTKGHEWRHVSGKDNPADLVSRGCSIESLRNSQLWWGGPQFLQNFDYENTLSHSDTESVCADLPELKANDTFNFVTQQENDLFYFSRFSRFDRMQRAGAYVLRFIHNARNNHNKRTGALTVIELEESTLLLASLSQKESFPDLYTSFIKGGSVNITQAHLSKLNLFFDNNTKLIRVGGRLQNADQFSFDKKHPILISSKHRFTVLLFNHKHKELMHAAPQLLLYTIRESWWPIGGRNLARSTYRTCIKCARLRGNIIAPIMGNLPQERLDAGFPFMRCGVDYAGPMLILNRKGRGAKTTKAYICLFICFTSRAIHLELVSDLSSNSYLLALKRFISRRGKPVEIFSDNGKNFVGLMNEFNTFLNKCGDEIKEYATSQCIKFNMIPPYASHFGGLWEAGVRNCKYHLRRVVGNAHLTFEEFSTVLTQVEAILNSRPLTPLSSDPQDFLPLTPAHFLVGRPLTAPVCADVSSVSESRLTRYQRVEQIRQHFWARWSKEYVSELQVRVKWQKKQDDLKKDTLVLIKDDGLPPLKWNLGRIIETFPGRDGVARVASVRTADGVVRRAFSKLCPLPLHAN